MTRNRFITLALEELQQESGEASLGTNVERVTTPIADGVQQQPVESGNGITETNIDSSTDAVAELMEQNATLATENEELGDANAELEGEVFDNDTDAIQTVSDSVSGDLDEAVNASVALEELAHICALTAKGGMANAGAVAGLAFALEQICDRVGISGVAALEEGEVADVQPTEQAEKIGEAAKEKSASIMQRIVASIKKIIGWIINVVRNMMASTGKLVERAKALQADVRFIDESKTIDSKSFIASLRLVEGAGDANRQFEEYITTSTKAVYGFFNDKFVDQMESAWSEVTRANMSAGLMGQQKVDGNSHFGEKLAVVINSLFQNIFTEQGSIEDTSGVKPDDKLTVRLTPASIGGVQLFFASSFGPGQKKGEAQVRAGLAKRAPKFDAPDTIPVCSKRLAGAGLSAVSRWMQDQKDLQARLSKLQGIATNGTIMSTDASSIYVSVLAAIATAALPHLLRANLQNAARLVAYAEKSIAVSKGTAGASDVKATDVK